MNKFLPIMCVLLFSGCVFDKQYVDRVVVEKVPVSGCPTFTIPKVINTKNDYNNHVNLIKKRHLVEEALKACIKKQK